jgi:ribosomal protein S7
MSEPLDTLRAVCGLSKTAPESTVYTAIGLINALKEKTSAMESVLAKIGKHFDVQPGDVGGLFAAIESQSAENKRYREALRWIERDLGAEHAARQWAHDALVEHATEPSPREMRDSGRE